MFYKKEGIYVRVINEKRGVWTVQTKTLNENTAVIKFFLKD